MTYVPKCSEIAFHPKSNTYIHYKQHCIATKLFLAYNYTFESQIIQKVWKFGGC